MKEISPNPLGFLPAPPRRTSALPGCPSPVLARGDSVRRRRPAWPGPSHRRLPPSRNWHRRPLPWRLPGKGATPSRCQPHCPEAGPERPRRFPPAGAPRGCRCVCKGRCSRDSIFAEPPRDSEVRKWHLEPLLAFPGLVST